MAVKEGGVSGAIEEVDAGFLAGRTSLWPIPAASWVSYALKSGALTGLSAADPVFSFSNSSSNLVLVRRVSLGFVLTTAFSSAQLVDFGLYVARGFSAPDQGGTAATLTGDNGLHRTSLSPLTAADLRIGDTGALTEGTRTLDADPIALAAGWLLTQGDTIAMRDIFNAGAAGYPLVLQEEEGVVINALTAFGASGAGTLYVGIELAEVDDF
jgi:hypothetical protein